MSEAITAEAAKTALWNEIRSLEEKARAYYLQGLSDKADALLEMAAMQRRRLREHEDAKPKRKAKFLRKHDLRNCKAGGVYEVIALTEYFIEVVGDGFQYGFKYDTPEQLKEEWSVLA